MKKIQTYKLYTESLRDKLKGKSYDEILIKTYNILLQNNTVTLDKDFDIRNDNFGWSIHKMKGWLEEKFDRYTEGKGVYLLIRPNNVIPFKNVYKYKTFDYNSYSSFIKYDVPKKYFKFFLKQLIIRTLSGEYDNFHIKIVGNYLDKLNESLKDKLKGKSKEEILSNPTFKYKSNEEIFILACKYGEMWLVEDMIEKGVDITSHNMDGLYYALRYGHLKIAKYLLDKEEIINSMDEDFVDNILMKMVGKSDTVVKFIIKNPVMIKHINPDYLKELEEYLDEE